MEKETNFISEKIFINMNDGNFEKSGAGYFEEDINLIEVKNLNFSNFDIFLKDKNDENQINNSEDLNFKFLNKVRKNNVSIKKNDLREEEKNLIKKLKRKKEEIKELFNLLRQIEAKSEKTDNDKKIMESLKNNIKVEIAKISEIERELRVYNE